MVDIKFSNINPKTLVFNELYSPIFEKNKKMKSFEQSTLQLLNIMVRDENMEKINSFPFTSKTKSTLKEKVYTLYAEDLHFLITRTGWLITHIYQHFTFEQSKFNKDFVLMNQKATATEEVTVILESTVETTSILASWNLYMMIFLKFPTLKNLQQFSMMIHL